MLRLTITPDFMPVSYRIPQHLEGVTPAQIGSLIQGGQRLQLEKARLGQHAQQAQQEMAIRADMANKEHNQNMARLEVEKAYKEIQATVATKQLEQAGQMLAIKTQQVARQFQAQEQYRRAVEGGMPATEAMLRFGPMAFGGAPSGQLARYSDWQKSGAQVPLTTAEAGGEKFAMAVNPVTGTPTVRQVRKDSDRLTAQNKLTYLARQRKRVLDDNPAMAEFLNLEKTKPEWSQRRKMEWSKLKRDLYDIDQKMNEITKASGLDLPPSAFAEEEPEPEETTEASTNVKSMRLLSK